MMYTNNMRMMANGCVYTLHLWTGRFAQRIYVKSVDGKDGDAENELGYIEIGTMEPHLYSRFVGNVEAIVDFVVGLEFDYGGDDDEEEEEFDENSAYAHMRPGCSLSWEMVGGRCLQTVRDWTDKIVWQEQ